MILNLGSLAFNANLSSGGGTPAWGTELGQGEGYKFSFENMSDFFTGMVYASVPDINEVTCPLGKGGNQQKDYDFVIASLFTKVFVNGKRITDASFLLLIVKKIRGEHHVGRRTIKYNPKITYRGEYINEECFERIPETLDIPDDSAWFVHEINIKNQDELHFTVYVLGESPKTYSSIDERKRDFISRLPKAGTYDVSHSSFTQLGLNHSLQQIFYGAPGTGKSREVKKQTGELLDNGEEQDLPNVFRTTFHPDTDYAAFVGCYKPTMKPTSKEEKTLTGKDEEIVYEFVPQTFTDAYIYAYTHSTEQTYLVIEEINRGNCAQIFGDLFQLLDRKGGVSEYKIKADKDLANYLIDTLGEDSEGIKDGKLCLPANLSILATMNTSDQSLFPMDSAFKRRWEWEYVPINYSTDIKSGTFNITIGEKTYLWVDFIKEANKKIFDLTQSEDKQLGNFFIKCSIDEKEFKSKVMFYLWYEVLRDETENNKYFFYKKTTIDGKEEIGKFIFKDLYEEDATQTLQQFMEYLGVAPK